MTDIFVQSFIKGLGKTTATLVVCGITGGILYYFTNQNSNLFNKNVLKKESKSMIDMETITVSDKNENIEDEHIVENYVENIVENNAVELDAKKLFDDMISKKRKWAFV